VLCAAVLNLEICVAFEFSYPSYLNPPSLPPKGGGRVLRREGVVVRSEIYHIEGIIGVV
jgi:hypothetical protein